MARKKNFKLIYALGFAAYAVIYIGRLNFSVASAYYESAGTLTKTQIGMITSIFSIVYAVSKVPDGFLGDILPSRDLIFTGLLIFGMANLMICISGNYLWIAGFWAFNAFGQAMLWGPLLKDFKGNYHADTYRKVAGTIGISIPVGSIIGLWVASTSIKYFSVQVGFLIPGILLLITAVFIRLFFINTEGKKERSTSAETELVKSLAKNKKLQKMLLPIMIHGMIKDNVTFWMALFFVDVYEIHISSVAGFVFVIPLFTLLGRCAWPLLIRIFRSEYTVTKICFPGIALCSIFLAAGNLSAAGALIALGMISALVSVINVHFLSTFPSELADTEHLAMTASFMDLLTYGGAGIGALIFGFLIPRYSFSVMFILWAVFSICSLFLMAGRTGGGAD